MKKGLRTVIVLLGIALTANALAGPALAWWHLTRNFSQATCVQRAKAAFAVEKFPIKRSSSSGIWGWNSEATVRIKCIKQGSNTMAVIIATSTDRRYAKYLMETFRDGIDTGVFE